MKRVLSALVPTRRILSILLAGALAWLSGCKPEGPGGGASSAGAAAVFPGYTLVQELTSTHTDLIDTEGRVVHRWNSKYKLGGGAYIQPNGNLLRTCILPRNPFNAACPGLSGAAELLDWDGNQLWSYEFGNKEKTLHHDITLLPNGNILMLGVEQKGKAEQLDLGRDPSRMRHDVMWFDYIVEIKPTGKSGGEVVWEWHMWDHLIQDFDPKKKNYGVVADYPEKIDINFIEENILARGNATMARLQSLGYVGGGGGAVDPRSGLPDWTHANSIAYNADLDQIVMSVRGPGELWIIDHSTSKEAAATDKGGRSGKGGRLLYRWGNPQAYQRGAPQDQMFFGQHDVHWIPKGCPGEGNLLVFNNGDNRKDGAYSSIEEIKPPLKADGSYEIKEGAAFGPEKPVWRYVASPKESFFSQFLSGVQRLPNGNTLICSGMTTEIFEVTSDGRTVWKKRLTDLPQNPAPEPPGRRMAQGGPGAMGPGGMGLGAMPQFQPAGNHGLTAAEIAFLMGPQSLFGPPPPMPPPPTGDPSSIAAGQIGPGAQAQGAASQPPRPPGPPGMGGLGMGGPGLAGPRAGPPGGGGPPGGPGSRPRMGGPGGGPPTKGLFRANRYAVDHPAFKGRKLEPLASAGVESE